MPADERQPAPDALSAIAALTEGTLTVEGRLPWSSNFTFLLAVDHDGEQSKAIYKPHEGEQPLWDFPGGLYRREVAAYELALALGWPRVPETVIRDDAPFGIGSLQRFVPADFSQHYFTLLEDPRHHDALFEIAIFDVVANNADRKAGHCLISEDGDIWGIDHGLCFHEEVKLRTVVWDFGGEPVPAALVADLRRVSEALPASLTDLLSSAELTALGDRLIGLAEHPHLPEVKSDRQYPWPLV